ncbi:MAG: FAD-dependent oxidoreductase [Actinomycetota bacterium]|nr:FAD-dependent oxidoreductase [Actinomycetota bacterium]
MTAYLSRMVFSYRARPAMVAGSFSGGTVAVGETYINTKGCLVTNCAGIVDFLVIGGGTAGIIGAKTASGFGARTVLVEREHTGGDCLWTGCVPSKTILSAAERAKTERALTGRAPDFAAVRERIFRTIHTIEPADSPAALEAAGVEVIKGVARFVAPGEVDVDGRTIRFRQALIATGAEPLSPRIPGLNVSATVTSETIWNLADLPARLAIVGGGPVGCELGQAFARLGSEVTMIVRSRVLAKEDPEAAAVVRESLETDGVRILDHVRVQRATDAQGASRIHLGDGTFVEADTVLLATGRTPRTAGLGLDRIGVTLDGYGRVVTDPRMRTSNPLIRAAGDVTANPRFTHLAGVHASVAASNAVLGLSRRISTTIPRVTYTSPELAAVGLTETGSNGRTQARTVRHAHIDRAVTEGSTAGFTRLIVDRRGRILGGTIVSPRAGESLAELTVAVQKNLTTSDIAGITHAYPTYSDGVWNAAIADARNRLAAPLIRRSIQALVFLRRRRLDRAVLHRRHR